MTSVHDQLSPSPLQVLDLRHYSASSLRPVLEAENRVWAEKLSWDYRASIEMLLQYLDARALPGFVALEDGRVMGYAFCVYEDRKAVIGDVFALDTSSYGYTQQQIEATLLEHVFSLLQNTPGVERIECQMLLHREDLYGAQFREAGFSVYPRLFMDMDLSPGMFGAASTDALTARTGTGMTLRPWQEADFQPAGSLIARAYEGHLDATINDQYRSVAGSLRFLHNIIRFPGCGTFDPNASYVVVDRQNALTGMILCSRVRGDVEHVTQLCVAPSARGAGLGATLLQVAATGLAERGFAKLSLTVTAGNSRAAALYARNGFAERHSFDATVWMRARGADSLRAKSERVGPFLTARG